MPRLLLTIVLTIVAATLAPSVAQEIDCRERARSAALAFGDSLTSAKPASMRSVLPDKGKVLLRLVHLGPEDGYYSADQVGALFQDFLRNGSIRSFDLIRVEADDECFALVHCRAALTDRDGRPARVDIQLTVQPEESRWIVREIRELRR